MNDAMPQEVRDAYFTWMEQTKVLMECVPQFDDVLDKAVIATCENLIKEIQSEDGKEYLRSN